MSLAALALVVLGALIHASWNLLAKKASGGAPFVWLYGLVSLVLATPFCIYAWQTETGTLGVAAVIAIVASAATHLVYSLTLQKGYQASDFSLVYPLARGTGPLFAVLGAILLLQERPTLLGWLGIASILLGILLVADLLAGVHQRAERVRSGLLWGVLTGLSIAAYTVVDGWAVKTLGLSPILYYVLGLYVRTLLLAPSALRNVEALRVQWKRNARYILAVGALSPLAYTLVLYAMQRAPLAYVAPARELSMLLGVILGARILRESFTPARIAGTVLMVTGVTCLALAK